MIAEDLKDWVMVYAGGQRLVGKLVTDESGTRLSPVCEMRISLVNDGQRGLNILRELLPFAMWMSVESIELPAGLLKFPLARLSGEEQKEMLQKIDLFEDQLRQSKAASAGIHLVK